MTEPYEAKIYLDDAVLLDAEGRAVHHALHRGQSPREDLPRGVRVRRAAPLGCRPLRPGPDAADREPFSLVVQQC